MSTGFATNRTLTLVNLLAVLVMAALLLTLLLPALNAANEQSRFRQCENNLKAIGLAIHNFHDIRQEICPSYLTSDYETYEPTDHATWAVLLLPFLQQSALYERFDLKKPIGDEANSAGRATLVPSYFCPTRRPMPGLTTDNFASPGDYGNVAYGMTLAVNVRKPSTYNGSLAASRAFNPGPGQKMVSGFNLGAGDYRALTNFASVIDGLSNTAFMGEKAIHKDRLGAADVAATHQDGPLYGAKGGPLPDKSAFVRPGGMAFWSRRMAAETPDEPILLESPQTDDPNNRFGSWHPNLSLFLLGDGSVRAVPHATSSTMLERFGARNDRLPVDIPQPSQAELDAAIANPK